MLRESADALQTRREFLERASAGVAVAGLGWSSGHQDADKVLKAVDNRADLALLQEIVRIRSYSGAGEEGRLARVLAERMDTLGLKTRLVEVEPGRYNAIGVLAGSGGGRSLMLNGHID